MNEKLNLLKDVKLYHLYELKFHIPCILRCLRGPTRAVTQARMVFFRNNWGRLHYRAPNVGQGYGAEYLEDYLESVTEICREPEY